MEVGVANAAEEDFDLRYRVRVDRAGRSYLKPAAMSHWQLSKLSALRYELMPFAKYVCFCLFSPTGIVRR